MDTHEFDIGEVYAHEDYGRVRLVALPIEDPNGARVVILGGSDPDEQRWISVDRSTLSAIEETWGDDDYEPPSQDIL